MLLIILCSVITLGSSMTVPATNLDPTTTIQNMTGWSWYYVSGDGSQILPINGPQDKPASNLLNASASNGNAFSFGFSKEYGQELPRPHFAKFLFDCEFHLFDAPVLGNPVGTLPSGKGVWEPWPRGKYVCNGDSPGQLRMTLVRNTIGHNLAIHDLAFFVKVLHDERAVQDSTAFFNFAVYCSLDGAPAEQVADGQWGSKFGATVATA